MSGINAREVCMDGKGHPLWEVVRGLPYVITVEDAYLKKGDEGGEGCVEGMVDGGVGRLSAVVSVVAWEG